ncbi:MAG: tRNA (adenosine(37)-N6)-dimethylallyltransferase MiaA [Deinococcales bacterium]
MASAAVLIPILGGPTASGKSAVALKLAAELGLEIVAADAMQVYRGMDIGTAKPTPAEREQVPHHLIDVVTPAEPFSVADYVRRAEEALAAVLARGRLPLVVGGTGFYIRALAEGLPTAPPADPEAQAPLWKDYEKNGLGRMVAELERLSPQDAARAQRNPRRVIRALEVLRRTGRPPSAFPRTTPAFRYDKAVLLPPMDTLRPRIVQRTRRMFEAGLVSEVRALLEAYPDPLTALQAIGYKEVATHLAGRSTLEEAEVAVTIATLQYARRQRTWFRKEPEARHIPGLAEPVLGELRMWLRQRSQALAEG